MSGSRPEARQVAARVLSATRVREACGERVPPLILRAMTNGRMARSAALLSGGTVGVAHAGAPLVLKVAVLRQAT